MTAILWDQTGERYYETGVDRGVLYPLDTETKKYSPGVAWNGLINVTESPSGAEPTPLYADNIKYLNMVSAEEFGFTIEAYTYPDEFAECDGSASPVAGVAVSQQPRRTFGLSYRTLLGNDTVGNDHGYKLHLVWGALASPSEKAYATVNDTPEAITFSWTGATTPVAFTGEKYKDLKPSASMTIDSTKLDAAKLTALEDMLYGKGEAVPELPSPTEVLDLISA